MAASAALDARAAILAAAPRPPAVSTAPRLTTIPEVTEQKENPRQQPARPAHAAAPASPPADPKEARSNTKVAVETPSAAVASTLKTPRPSAAPDESKSAPVATFAPSSGAMHSPDPADGEAEEGAGGSRSEDPGMLRYVRADDAPSSGSGPANAPIGSRSSEAKPTRAHTNTRRSFGNGQGWDEALLAPKDAPQKEEASPAESRRAPVENTPVNGATPAPRLSMLPEGWSPKRARKHRKPKEVEPPKPSEHPLTIVVTAQPPAPADRDDGFWSPSEETAPPDIQTMAPPADAAAAIAARTAQKDGAAWSSQSVLDESVEAGDEAHASSRAHPLGVWMDGVDGQLRAAWIYPDDLRALGVDGVVTLRFLVKPNGKVDRIELLSGSGNGKLDRAALQSVPARVPPIPFGFGQQWVQYSFRYTGHSTMLPQPAAE